MLSYIFRQLISSFGIFFRTIRAFFTRRLTGLGARLRRMTNFSRQATRVASQSFQGAAAAVKKPTKREDYIETNRLFISKSFLIFLLVGIVALVCLIYFVIWPFMLSHFFTAHFYQEDSDLMDWSGKVIVYYDEEKTQPMYAGKVEDGVLQGRGTEYDEDGLVTYAGYFVDGEKSGSGKTYEQGVLVYDGEFMSGVYDGSGTLYEDGTVLYEGEFANGIYEGKGTLYEDGTVLYEGEFANGIYEGSGTLYEDDTVLYEGEFANGIYEGKGTLYEKGTVVYEGEFAAGLADGVGTAYYIDGGLLYEGSFSEGLYDGAGTVYYEDGICAYTGEFAAGLREGEGTEYRADGSILYKGSFVEDLYDGAGTTYYKDGTRSYTGEFVAGLREGEGTQYRTDGSILYKGSFAENVYEGSGTYYLEDDQGAIQANFTGGVTDGAIQWYKNGTLWYEGAADNLTPDGYGTIYARNGKAVYAGEMDRGTLDGVWLLSLTTEEVRKAFGDATLTETEYSGGGFLIANEELGLWVQCSYQQEDAEAAVYSLWFAADKAEDNMSSLMPWTDQDEFDAWVQDGDYAGVQTRQTAVVTLPDGLRSGAWNIDSYACDGGTFAGLLTAYGNSPEILCWTSDGQISSDVIDTTSTSASSDSNVLEDMEALLEALDQVEATGNGGSITTSGDVSRLVGLTQTAEDAQTLISALLDYYEYTQIQAALEECKPLLQQLLSEAETQLSRGTGSQETVDDLQTEIDAITLRLSQCTANIKQATLTVQELTLLDPSDYDLSELLCFFDPTELDVDALCQAAVDYAVAVAAGRYEVDDSALITQCKTAIINLQVYDSNVQSARSALERAVENVTTLTQSYGRGTTDKDTLYHAQCTQYEALANLYTALCIFMDQVNELNTLSGGWLCEELEWLDDVYPPIFEGEVIRGEEEAAKILEERAEREQEAQEQLAESQAAETAEEGAYEETVSEESTAEELPDDSQTDETVEIGASGEAVAEESTTKELPTDD